MASDRTTTHEALMLSEIRSHIGLFLIGRNADLIACMLVCRSWRADFRRLLYLSLELTGPTTGPIILPLQWRAFSSHTQSLSIEEPTVTSRRNDRATARRGYRSGTNKSGDSSSDSTLNPPTWRSPDYNLDPALHCPNLLHLTVRMNQKFLPLCCWTSPDDWFEVGENGTILQDDKQDQGSLYQTSAVVRYNKHQDPFLVKTSNRILALLHYHPQLQTFRWIGASDLHIHHIGTFLLTRQHQLVELQLERLVASVPELNLLIANCPNLRRLHLTALTIRDTPGWDDPAIHTRPATLTSGQFAAIPITAFGLPSPETPTADDLPSVVLELPRLYSFTLLEPHFSLRSRLCVYSPVLEQLALSRCFFDADATAEAENTMEAVQTRHPGIYWHCPKLKSYGHEVGGFYSRFAFCNLLDSSRNSIKSLSLNSYLLESNMVRNLIALDICKNLTRINLRQSSWLKSTSIQELLCHCSELTDFMGPQGVLWGEDLLRSTQEWACVKLKSLRLLVGLARPDSGIWERSSRHGQTSGPLGFPLQRILGDRFETTLQIPGGQRAESPTASEDDVQLRDIQDAIFAQLSRLTDLEVLDLTGGTSFSSSFLIEYPRGIPWTLEAGLGQLGGLSKMRELVVSGWEDRMTRREARWLKHHWTDLRSILNMSGNLAEGHAADNKTPDEEQVIGWLAFEICLAQEWPERFPGAFRLIGDQ
ncbi:hypothetical protein BGZ99_008433 [Dissophora globulifera]|uniref:F-box domain-containing protein n=1 Tax=Dissophora globulifera TaxID=979702 RepID=A0A9P6UPN8_9FUNG|nr:hypothetical protein BGZ99_008433 [Dissophora globulifera]